MTTVLLQSPKWTTETWKQWLEKIRAPFTESNFPNNWFEPQAWRLTFTRKMTALNVNLGVLAGKLHYVTFRVITRNITRLIKTPISR